MKEEEKVAVAETTEDKKVSKKKGFLKANFYKDDGEALDTSRILNVFGCVMLIGVGVKALSSVYGVGEMLDDRTASLLFKVGSLSVGTYRVAQITKADGVKSIMNSIGNLVGKKKD